MRRSDSVPAVLAPRDRLGPQVARRGHVPVPCPVVGLLLLLVVAPLFAGQEGSVAIQDRQTAGPWVATVEATMVGSPDRRALKYHQRVLRQGPADERPELLYEQASTGRVRIRLRDDGLVLVEPVGPRPRLFFPGSPSPVELALPLPEGVDDKYISTYFDSTWFFGESLLYSRTVRSGNLMLIGLMRIDTEKRAVVESRLCVEVADDQGTSSSEVNAAQMCPPVFQTGDSVFWINLGYDNAFYPDAVKGEWKDSKVRALSLKTCRLVDPDEVPAESLRQDKDRLLTFVENEAHNTYPKQLEIWAVGVLARFGGPGDAERLRALSSTVTDLELGQAYAAALEVLDGRGTETRDQPVEEGPPEEPKKK